MPVDSSVSSVLKRVAGEPDPSKLVSMTVWGVFLFVLFQFIYNRVEVYSPSIFVGMAEAASENGDFLISGSQSARFHTV